LIRLHRSDERRLKAKGDVHGLFDDVEASGLLSGRAGFDPAFDISETENQLMATATIPGMDKKNIDIHLTEESI
jgi:HSP20 family molecular chaperone IbpA